MNGTQITEQVLQGVRTWLKSNGSAAGLTDAQVWVDSSKGTRPALPYLTVKMTASDIPVGEDEVVSRIGDTFVVGTGATGSTYALVVNGEAVSYVRLSADTNATVAAALVALINADADLDAVYAEVDSSAASPTFWVAAMAGALVTSTADAKLTRTEDGASLEEQIGTRRASVSVQALGESAAEWLERSVRRLSLDSVTIDLQTAGLSIRPLGGMTDLGKLLDTAIEARVLREFEVSYAIRTEPALMVPLETVITTATLRKSADDVSVLTSTITVEVP